MTAKIAALALVAITLGSATTASSAYAQTYPSRPITLVVPFGPGGSIDSVGRMVGEHLSARLGKTLVIENRPGGGTNVATVGVARAAPDGHTLLITTSSLAINATLYKSIPYDAGNDLTPVALVANIPLVLVVNRCRRDPSRNLSRSQRKRPAAYPMLRVVRDRRHISPPNCSNTWPVSI